MQNWLDGSRFQAELAECLQIEYEGERCTKLRVEKGMCVDQGYVIVKLGLPKPGRHTIMRTTTASVTVHAITVMDKTKQL